MKQVLRVILTPRLDPLPDRNQAGSQGSPQIHFLVGSSANRSGTKTVETREAPRQSPITMRTHTVPLCQWEGDRGEEGDTC